MPVTIDKMLGKALLHKHQLSDIIVSSSGGALNTTSVTTVTSNNSPTTQTVILSDATTGPITITLPQASTVNNTIYTIKKIDASSNSIVVDGYNTETIDNNQTILFVNKFSVKI
ncbi:MAG TPA: hypothetical protein VMR41_00900 [Patescibacteria group bacterium]|nr:hypothetical protein [Patescibacteria group bacterium]